MFLITNISSKRFLFSKKAACYIFYVFMYVYICVSMLCAIKSNCMVSTVKFQKKISAKCFFYLHFSISISTCTMLGTMLRGGSKTIVSNRSKFTWVAECYEDFCYLIFTYLQLLASIDACSWLFWPELLNLQIGRADSFREILD